MQGAGQRAGCGEPDSGPGGDPLGRGAPPGGRSRHGPRPSWPSPQAPPEWGAPPGVPGQVTSSQGKAPAPPTAEVSSPRLLPPPESPPGLPRMTQSRARIASPPTTHRSARRNYRIACARLMRSNYPPPLSSPRSAALGQRAVISCPSRVLELSPGSRSARIGLRVAASCRTLGLPRGPRREL